MSGFNGLSTNHASGNRQPLTRLLGDSAVRNRGDLYQYHGRATVSFHTSFGVRRTGAAG